jgi:citrate synthase
VDWAAARTLTLLNVPEDRISLAIGIARMVGWAAQTIEQHTSRIQLLPSLRYAGDAPEVT